MHIELNEDQTRALVQLLLTELEATKTFLSMEEDHIQAVKEALDNRLDEIVALKAEVKALKATQTAKPAKKVKVTKVVEPVKRGRGRPKKTVE